MLFAWKRYPCATSRTTRWVAESWNSTVVEAIALESESNYRTGKGCHGRRGGGREEWGLSAYQSFGKRGVLGHVYIIHYRFAQR